MIYFDKVLVKIIAYSQSFVSLNNCLNVQGIKYFLLFRFFKSNSPKFARTPYLLSTQFVCKSVTFLFYLVVGTDMSKSWLIKDNIYTNVDVAWTKILLHWMSDKSGCHFEKFRYILLANKIIQYIPKRLLNINIRILVA